MGMFFHSSEAPAERPADPEVRRANLNRIGRLFAAYRLRLGGVLLLIVVSAGLGVVPAFLLKNVLEAIGRNDTTSLSFTHRVASELGDLGGPAGTEALGFFVHSALLLDARTGMTVGLVAQDYWMRDPAERGKRHERRQRAYEDKESFKWQRPGVSRFAPRR